MPIYYRLFVFLFIVTSVLSYVGWHVWSLLPWTVVWKSVTIALGIACFLSFFFVVTGRSDGLPMPLARALYNISTSSLIVLLYLFLLFLLSDLGWLCGIVPRSLLHDNGPAALGITLLLSGLLFYGNLRYRHKVRVPLTIETGKTLPKSYRVVMASDLHVGYHNDRKELARWIDLINREEPDFILMAGDILDNSMRPVIVEDMAAEFRRLRAPVYACLGNHEYYSGTPRARQFYHEAGINLLIDSVATIDSALVIVGRDDRTNPRRKTLDELTATADKSKCILVLDHQPAHLEQAEQAGVDFQLSGHTHRGQVWPISWLTERMYECSWGSHRCGATQYYVSSGLGIWGGKYRIGTQSEYVVAEIK